MTLVASPPRAAGLRINSRLAIGAGFLLLLLLVALFAPQLAPHDPSEQDLLSANLKPFWMAGADPGHLLGADSLGRDVASRLIWGARPAVYVMSMGAIFSGLFGVSAGVAAGYFGGAVDGVISRVVDVFMSFPPMLLAILLVAVIGAGLDSVIVAIVLVGWTRFARVVRAETLVLRERDFITSARLLGFSHLRVIASEILPNLAPLCWSLIALEMARALIVEGVLAFIGFSSSSAPTWGGVLADGRLYIYQAWWVMAFPIACIVASVAALGLLADGLSQTFDPLLRR